MLSPVRKPSGTDPVSGGASLEAVGLAGSERRRPPRGRPRPREARAPALPSSPSARGSADTSFVSRWTSPPVTGRRWGAGAVATGFTWEIPIRRACGQPGWRLWTLYRPVSAPTPPSGGAGVGAGTRLVSSHALSDTGRKQRGVIFRCPGRSHLSGLARVAAGGPTESTQRGVPRAVGLLRSRLCSRHRHGRWLAATQQRESHSPAALEPLRELDRVAGRPGDHHRGNALCRRPNVLEAAVVRAGRARDRGRGGTLCRVPLAQVSSRHGRLSRRGAPSTVPAGPSGRPGARRAPAQIKQIHPITLTTSLSRFTIIASYECAEPLRFRNAGTADDGDEARLLRRSGRQA